MNDTVWIALIVALAVIVVLWMFRPMLSRFFLKVGKEGVEADLETRERQSQQPGGFRRFLTNVSRNWQIGRGNKMTITGSGTNFEGNAQVGKEQELNVTDPDKPAAPPTKKRQKRK